MTAYRPPEHFSTPRYRVRRVRVSDAEAIFNGWATDLEIAKYLVWRPSTFIAQTRAFTERAELEWHQGTGFPCVISPLDAPEALVGMVHPRLSSGAVSYGWLVRKDHWGRGIASEVTVWLVENALAHSDIFRTEATCDVENIASVRVMEKIGMTREGVLRRHTVRPNISNEPRDSLLFARVR